ncbi:hypothetical protein R6V09_37145 [Streptomyces sp. W16]|uniref:VMAP-C domain-containing protein n=1 Tax=Streptomyces sp. W16 TaxID=3076631 RepID=UPI00295B4860|nr:hypothetical protein [Streptomyces sp. W16]MDV9175729.1 hypothetical protein [Streptomyces sp. W16]
MSRWRRLVGGGAGHLADPRVRSKTIRLLVQTLAGIRRLQSVDGRLDLLDEVGPPLRDAVRANPVTADHLRAMVHTARRKGQLPLLRDALLELEGDDIGAAWFDLAVTIMTEPGPLPTASMLEAVAELQLYEPEFGLRARSQYASEHRGDGPPLGNGPLPKVLSRLYEPMKDPADPDAPRRRLLRFLELLGEEAVLEGPGGDRLARQLARIQDRHGGKAPGGHPATPAPEPAPAGMERQVIIQIRVEEAGAPSDLPAAERSYSLHGFLYELVGTDRPVFRGSRTVPGLITGGELTDRGHKFLAEWREQAEAVRDVRRRRVEFLLPHSLLGYPAELWPSGSAEVPLSRSCQVVVRSLTRYKDSTIHDEWIRRWRALDRDCPPGDALQRIGWLSKDTPGEPAEGHNPPKEQWSCPQGKFPPLRLTHPADIEDWLRTNADLACLGLTMAYDHHDVLVRDAVRDAILEDGIPVMVWRRDKGDPDRLLDALRSAEPPALLADLPRSVLQARKRERGDSLSVGNNISLLWDDPTCVFSGQDPQMSGIGGAEEGAT